MQFDAIVAAAIGGLTGVFSAGLAWGLITQKVSALQTGLKEHRDDSERKHQLFVTHAYFEAVTSPILRAIETMEKDIKEILKAVKS